METIYFSFTWKGLLFTLFMLASIVAAILLIVLMLRLIRFIGKVDAFIDQSRPSIDATIRKMPSIAQSMEDAALDIQSVTDGVSNVFHIFRKFSGK